MPGRAELAVDARLAQLVQQILIKIALVVIGIFRHQLIHGIHAVHHARQHQRGRQLKNRIAHVLTIGTVLALAQILDEREHQLLDHRVHPPGIKIPEHRPLQLPPIDFALADGDFACEHALVGQTQHGTLPGPQIVRGIQIVDEHQIGHLLDHIQGVRQSARPENLPQGVNFVSQFACQHKDTS